MNVPNTFYQFNSHLDCVEQKGTKPQQLLPNLTEQFNFLQENISADSFANFEEYASYCTENSLKFAQESAQLLLCKTLMAQLNLALPGVAWFLSAQGGLFFSQQGVCLCIDSSPSMPQAHLKVQS